jgi:hypothetical protein
MKYFRLRRCEASKGDGSIMSGKMVNLVAAAGGAGNGTISYLTDMELWRRHTCAPFPSNVSASHASPYCPAPSRKEFFRKRSGFGGPQQKSRTPGFQFATFYLIDLVYLV